MLALALSLLQVAPAAPHPTPDVPADAPPAAYDAWGGAPPFSARPSGRRAGTFGPHAPRDTVDLAALRAAAVSRDPRAVQPGLYERAARLRIEAIDAERLPQFALTGQATAQSDVPSVPVTLPDGTAPSAPKEQARVQAEADWSVYDGGRRGLRADLERARLGEQTAGVAVALYPLREATTEAFFGAVLARAQAETLALAAEDLGARLALLRRQADEGAALDASADAVEAELIRVRQQVGEAEARRRAALDVLSDLADVPLDTADVLVLPDLDAPLDLLSAGDVPMERPEFERFRATQARAGAEARLAEAATRPTVSVFGQAGIGRPGPFDFLSDDVREYAQVGVRVRWVPFDWGRSRREAEAARLQAEVARTEAAAFARRITRDVADDVADIERLQGALALDDRAVALREEALRVAARQLDEGVLLPDVYTDRVTDLAEARLTRERHRVEIARARARLLTTLGLFPDGPPDR